MTGKLFADTNLIVYSESNDGSKSARARSIIESGPVISVQVVNEAVAVLTRKYGFTLSEAHEIAECLLEICDVVPVEANTIREAIRRVRRYGLSHWDSLVIAAALLSGCSTLYSEDLQHGQVIDGKLTVINPFLAED
jgi:predicted nucleic acid-binding protein